MNYQHNLQQQHIQQQLKHNLQQSKIKLQELTASKERKNSEDIKRSSRIRSQIFACFRHERLKGDLSGFLSQNTPTRIYKSTQSLQQNIKITFGEHYPDTPPQLSIHSCSLIHNHPQYIISTFVLMQPELLNWKCSYQLANILANVYQNIQDFHQSEIQRLFKNKENENSYEEEEQDEQKETQSKRQRRKSSTMTGCADKELTQTKNLNRHFRSKLRQVLRDLTADSEHLSEEAKAIESIFIPNRVGFEDIRRALNNKWFNAGVRRQMNSGQFLHKILRGMMGIKSKKLMIKYYHVMVSAVEDPVNFIRWKYD